MVATKPLPLALFLAVIPLAGCAKDVDKYPSLSIREAERVTGTFQPPPQKPAPPPVPSTAVLGQIDSLRADAAKANARFLAAANRAKGPTNAARGSSPGSEAWSIAQIALADLSSARSDAMTALAELDGIYVAAVNDGNDLTQILAAREEVQSLVDSEDRTMSELDGQLSK